MNCFSGKLSCHFNEVESGKVYEWKHAIVTYYEEIAHSLTGEPMKTRVIFSPFDLRVNNLLISRYSTKAEKGTWYFYEPEEEIEKQPVEKEQILAIKTIECLNLDTDECGRKGIKRGKKYTFKITEYQKDIPTESEKQKIIWEFSYKEEIKGIVVGTELRKRDTFTFDTSRHNIEGNYLTIMAHFENDNEKVALDLNVLNDYAVIVGFEVNNSNAYGNLEKTFEYEGLVGMEYLKTSMTQIEKDVFWIDEDRGHAFYYLSKNGKVQGFLSLGPEGKGLRRLYGDGTPDFRITERTRLFKISLSFIEYELLLEETNVTRESILSGTAFKDINYNVFVNDTCASIAQETLQKIIPHKIPDGKGLTGVKGGSVIKVINPYTWYNSFKRSRWNETEREVSANEKLWQQIMKQCLLDDKPIDPYCNK